MASLPPSFGASHPTAGHEPGHPHKKRRRAFTATDRAQHRVIEKQRREALNDRFIDLARLLPALAPVRRLSKGLILDASVAHLRALRAAAPELRALLAERDALFAARAEADTLHAEIDALRARLGEPPRERGTARGEAQGGARQCRKTTRREAARVLALLEAPCGPFPRGFGDNGAEGEGGDGEDRIEGVGGDEAGGSGESGESDGRGSGSPEGGGVMCTVRDATGRQDASRTGFSEEPAVRVNGDFGMEGVVAGGGSHTLGGDLFSPRGHSFALRPDPFSPCTDPLAASSALSDEDLLAILSADLGPAPLGLGEDRPASLPQVYPDKAAPDLSPSQIEELWRQLGSVEIPDLGGAMGMDGLGGAVDVHGMVGVHRAQQAEYHGSQTPDALFALNVQPSATHAGGIFGF
ncbi:hypothetical protein HDZ31DRAFT_60937 [Schizophyllum fasciatum]